MNTNTAGTWTSSSSLYGASEIQVSDENNNPLTPKITIGGTGTLADAAAAINASSHGLTASVVQINSGEAALRISAKETGLGSKFSLTGAGSFTINTAAADAKIDMGTTSPVSVSSSTNTFDSVMDGVTFTVSKVDEVATLTVAADPNAVAAKVQTLVDAVNAAVKHTREYTANGPDSKAELNGDYAVGALAGRLLDAVSYAVVNPADGKKVSPATMGLQLSKDGKKVEFDKNVFLNALKADPTLAQLVVGGTAAGIGPDELPGTADDVATSGIAGRLLAVAKAASDSTTGSLVALSKGQESLIKGYKEQIEAWDVRLAKRKEMLTRQFTAMETALSSLRNQSTWLAGQINQLS
jgi:flagellar hook-associated protein 2